MGIIEAASTAGGAITFLVVIALVVLYVGSYWRIFEKAGKPGWGAIIPIYNIYLICKVAGRPGWWVILYFIPFVNFVITLLVSLDLAKAFSKSQGFGIGLWLLSIIFYPILGWGKTTYTGPLTTRT